MFTHVYKAMEKTLLKFVTVTEVQVISKDTSYHLSWLKDSIAKK